MIQALIHASIVLGIGLLICGLVRRRPVLAGAIALITLTTDLAAGQFTVDLHRTPSCHTRN